MLMVLVQHLLWPDAQRAVVPLAAAGLVICTGLIGSHVGGAGIAVASSLLLATSPPFVYQSLQPMSDVPVAFWWTLSAVFAFSRNRAANIAAGATVAAAVITRPNLISNDRAAGSVRLPHEPARRPPAQPASCCGRCDWHSGGGSHDGHGEHDLLRLS
jgi:hypothetical protein